MKLPAALFLIAPLCMLTLTSNEAHGGPYSDDLAKCLVASTTTADKSTLVQWMFATASLHPDVKWMTTVSESQRGDLNVKLANLFQTLLTKSCQPQAKQALKYEGQGTIETSFNVLGQVAARELFSHPSVVAGMNDLGKNFDKEELEKALGPDK